MRDEDFVARLNELDGKGKDALPDMRELLRTEGGISRLIALASKGTPPEKPKKPRAPRPTDEPEGFAEWYAAYPRHIARAAAAAAYRRAVKCVSAETLLAAAKRYAKDCTDPQYTKHPATWLNAGCWADEPAGLLLVHSAALFEDASVDGWVMRLEIFHGFTAEPKGTWLDKWAGRPDTPGHKVKHEAWPIFWRMHPEMKPAVTG